MNILKKYYQTFDNKDIGHDFSLIQYSEQLFVGRDNLGHASIVILSNRPNRTPIRQKTKLLSVECNVSVVYNLEGIKRQDVVHIIRCLADSKKEEEIFVELTPLFNEPSLDNDQEDAILETVSILSSFFADKSEPSYNELQGLFAELYTIWSYADTVDLSYYWQSKDRMKFDFSLTETDKIEIKSTLKNERRHHFRHEQLLSDIFQVYVISYMLRIDDEGLSLYELISKTKPMLQHDPRKVLIVDKYIKNTSEERLREIRYNEHLLQYCRKIYMADEIPKFREHTPSGVSNAEYDCILDNAKDISEKQFLDEIKKIVSSED